MKISIFLKCFLFIVFFLLLYIFLKKPDERIYNVNVIKTPNNSALVEDFNDEINKNYWNIVDRGENCNNELQYYKPENVNIKDGFLQLEAKKEEFENHHYTSGMIDTKDKFEFLYGKIIFKAKPATGKGMLSAIWLLPADDSLLPEIDIIEILGTGYNEAWTGLHYLDSNSIQKSNFVNYTNNKEFDTYELDWNENEIKYYVNNQLIYQTNVGVPNKKMYLIINLSVGGDWPKDPDDNIFPVNFTLDYITIIPKELDVP